MPELTDSELIESLKSSRMKERNTAFKQIYKLNYNMVAAYISKNSGTGADAEDIFQDGLIALYQQVRDNSFKGSSAIKTYLFSICRNLWMKRLRKSSTSKEGFELDPAMATEDALVIDEMIADETTSALADLIDRIGEDCKKVLTHFYYEKRKMQEIAALMGFASEQVAKNKKNRCLKQLRNLATDLKGFGA